MQRVLVTGASGMLGRSLVPVLEGAGFDVIGHAHGSDGYRCADLSRRDQAWALLDDVAPSVVVNLAALTDVDFCEDEPVRAFATNVLSVANIGSWIRRRGDCYLVHLSTDQVYDGAGPHAEESITITNVYGMTKYASELAAQLIPSTTLRTNFFGPSRHPVRRSLSDWILDRLREKHPFTAFADIMFSPLSIDTLCRMIALSVARRPRGVFNLGSRDGCSKADFAIRLARARGIPTDGIRPGASSGVGLRAYRPKDMRLDSRAFEKALGVSLPTLDMEIRQLGGRHGTPEL